MKKLNKLIYASAIALTLFLSAHADKTLPVFVDYKSANTEKVQACQSLQKFIEEYISIVTYCENAEDCSQPIDYPFGCNISVEKKNEAEIRGILSSHEKLCLSNVVKRCLSAEPPQCINHQCRVN